MRVVGSAAAADDIVSELAHPQVFNRNLESLVGTSDYANSRQREGIGLGTKKVFVATIAPCDAIVASDCAPAVHLLKIATKMNSPAIRAN